MSDAIISNRGMKYGERMQQNSKSDTNFKRLCDEKKKMQTSQKVIVR